MANLLVVDDEEEICDFVKEVLTELNVDVKSVLTGEDAMELIKQQEWDIAMVDLRLSTSITGLDVIREIKEKRSKTYVIAMTGYVDVDLRQKAEKLGVNYFLEKPGGLLIKALTSKINEIISGMNS
ncbi:MAG: response regulator [Candidatus Omnitrophica bacterium]|nr:response regulator [Candidatus Omnitrophota bacterium]